jgi:hypothetical protein
MFPIKRERKKWIIYQQWAKKNSTVKNHVFIQQIRASKVPTVVAMDFFSVFSYVCDIENSFEMN